MNQPTKPGIYDNVPFADYLKWSAVNKHQLDLISRSPAHLAHDLAHPSPPSDPMIFGSAAHSHILPGQSKNPAGSPAIHVLPDDLNRRTKAGKELYANLLLRAGPNPLISTTQKRHLEGMYEAVYSHPRAKDWLSAGKAEQSMLWTDKETGLICKGRPDWIHPDGIIVDLKTCADARREAFSASAQRYRYECQAALYLHAARLLGATTRVPTEFLFLCVEKLPPYGVVLYKLDQEDLERGRIQVQEDLKRYKAYTEKSPEDPCPSYPTDLLTLSYSNWHRSYIDNRYETK